jgi:hypothetical protein
VEAVFKQMGERKRTMKANKMKKSTKVFASLVALGILIAVGIYALKQPLGWKPKEEIK